jgi:hypothetical protein
MTSKPPHITQMSATSPKSRLAIFVGVVAMAIFLSSSSWWTTPVEFARKVVETTTSSFLAAMMSLRPGGDDDIRTCPSSAPADTSSSAAETAGAFENSSSSPRPHRGKVIGPNVGAADVRGVLFFARSLLSRQREIFVRRYAALLHRANCVLFYGPHSE